MWKLRFKESNLAKDMHTSNSQLLTSIRVVATFFAISVLFLRQGFLYSSGYPRTHSVDQAVLELRDQLAIAS